MIICDNAMKPKPAIQYNTPLFLLAIRCIDNMSKFKIFTIHKTNFNVKISTCINNNYASIIIINNNII